MGALTNPASGVAPGTVAHFAANAAPPGWLKANGAAVSRTAYAALFQAIGTTYGAGDGSTTFNLPDLRGEFLRGWDDGRGVDSGRAFGSGQSHAFANHAHGIITGNGAPTSNWGASRANGDGNRGQTDSTTTEGGSETRPRNVALLACIKF